MEPGVKATEPIALDDLFDRFNGIESRPIAQIRVSDRIRGRHRAVRYQNGGLNHILGEFKWTLYKVGQTSIKLKINLRRLTGQRGGNSTGAESRKGER